jgi:hypothetical protein
MQVSIQTLNDALVKLPVIVDSRKLDSLVVILI